MSILPHQQNKFDRTFSQNCQKNPVTSELLILISMFVDDTCMTVKLVQELQCPLNLLFPITKIATLILTVKRNIIVKIENHHLRFITNPVCVEGFDLNVL